MAATQYAQTIKRCADVFQRIDDQGENFDRTEALEVIDDLLNDHGLMSAREACELSACLSRSALAFEIDDESARAWQSCRDYAAENGV